MQIDFSVMEGICKMLELMDKSKIAKRYVWAISLLIIMCLHFSECGLFLLESI